MVVNLSLKPQGTTRKGGVILVPQNIRYCRRTRNISIGPEEITHFYIFLNNIQKNHMRKVEITKSSSRYLTTKWDVIGLDDVENLMYLYAWAFLLLFSFCLETFDLILFQCLFGYIHAPIMVHYSVLSCVTAKTAHQKNSISYKCWLQSWMGQAYIEESGLFLCKGSISFKNQKNLPYWGSNLCKFISTFMYALSELLID